MRVLEATASLNQEAIRAQLPSGVASSKSALSVALDELRQRELVELVPSEDRRERIHTLTRQSRALFVARKDLFVSRALGSGRGTAAEAGRAATGRKTGRLSQPEIKIATD